MKIITDSIENINRLAAEMIVEQVKNKPDSVLAFAAGRSTKGVYELLKGSGADFSGVEVFNICDYTEKSSLAAELNAELYAPLGITKVHSPDCADDEAAAKYDDAISAIGGIDLIVLGMGLNGHIGFNEPATFYDTKTHIAKLTDSTKRMKAADFGGEENVPDYAVTMGLKTICSAKRVLLIAFGEEKADVVHKLVYGKTSTYVPAAMLQMHMNMTLCLDNEAAAKL